MEQDARRAAYERVKARELLLRCRPGYVTPIIVDMKAYKAAGPCGRHRLATRPEPAMN